MKMKRMSNIRRYIAITLMLASAALLTVSGIWVYTLYQKAFEDNSDVVESYQTIRAINRTMLSVNDASLNVSSFIITSDRKFINKLPNLIISIRVNLATLAQLIQDDSTEVEMTRKLNVMIDKKIEFLQSVIKLNNGYNKNKLISNPNRLELTYSINQLMVEIKKIEIGQLERAMPVYQLSINKANRAFILLGSLNVLLILISFVFTRPLLSTDK